MSQKSSEMKAQGIDVINMSVGEPDFNTPDHIKQEAKIAIDEDYSKYSPVPGYPFLRQAIARKLERENHLHYSPDEILVSNGAKQSVCNTVMALVDDGEEVIIPAPYWVSYPQMVLLAGGKPVFVEAGFEQNFKMTAEQLEAAITPKTRMLILCSPSNPTGSVYSKDELKALADVILKHEDLFVLAHRSGSSKAVTSCKVSTPVVRAASVRRLRNLPISAISSVLKTCGRPSSAAGI